MQANYDEIFNDSRYHQLDTLVLTKPIIAAMMQSLQTQFTNLQQVENLMKTLEY